MATLTITVGILLAKKVRDYIKLMQFKEHNIDYWESTGWIEREFCIKGDDKTIIAMDADLKRWARTINES